MEQQSGHEKLRIYGEAIGFITYSDRILSELEKPSAAKDQMGRTAESIATEIADGNGRRTPRDRAHRFEIAYGSALEKGRMGK